MRAAPWPIDPFPQMIAACICVPMHGHAYTHHTHAYARAHTRTHKYVRIHALSQIHASTVTDMPTGRGSPGSEDGIKRIDSIAEGTKFVVLKFGGTSVSFSKTWAQIIQRVRELQEQGFRVMLVLSALSQVTNRLEMCIQEAVAHEELVSLQFIEDTHRRLAKEEGMDASCLKGVLEKISELSDLLQGVAMIGRIHDLIASFYICAYMSKYLCIKSI